VPESCPQKAVSVPVHVDAVRQRRQAFATRRYNRAMEERRWWWLHLLAYSIHAAVVEGLVIEGLDREMAEATAPEEDIDQYFREFYRALLNGVFGVRHQTRVRIVSPEFGAWRLTPERAKGVVESRGWNEFVQHYATYAWIEIDRAEAWLWTWLDPHSVTAWVSMPRIQEALVAARKVVPAPTAPNPSTTAPGTAIIDPLEIEVRNWFSGIVADHRNRGGRFTKQQAFNLAKERYPTISEHWFERRIYQPPTVPCEWLQRGRPKGSRNTKGR